MSDTLPSVPPIDPTDTASETRLERLRRQRRLSFRRWAQAFSYDVLLLLREARVPLIGFGVVLASGTLYLYYLYGGGQAFPSLRAALYETLTMLALEQDVNFPADALGQFLFFAIPTLGLGFVFQGVLDFGKRLLDKSSRLEGWQISQARTYRDHIILCGLGRVSYRVMMQLLDAGYEVVVIEEDWEGEFVPEALTLKVPVIHGDARQPHTLRQAGLMRARSLITAINDDLLNIEVALMARRIRPKLHVVLRIFNEHLDYNLEKSKFGPNTAFSSSGLSAPTLAAAAVCRGIRYALPLPEAFCGIAEVIVSAGSRLDNLVYHIEQEFGVQVICYTSDRHTGDTHWRHHVGATTRLYGGDRVLLFGTLQALGDIWQHGSTRNRIMQTLGITTIQQHLTPQYNRVIVCGLGKVGYQVVRALHRMEPRPNIVVIYDKGTTPRFIAETEALGIEAMQGDARTEEMLYAAGIERAYSVVAVTSDNLSNLRIGLIARQIRSDIHLVLRVFSDVLADQLDDIFGIHTTFSSSALAAPTLAAAAVVKHTSYAIDIGNRLISSVRLTVHEGDEFAGRTAQAVREEYGMVVVTVRRAGQTTLLPWSLNKPACMFDGPLYAGDDIVVMADVQTIGRLHNRGAQSAIIDPGITGAPTPSARTLALRTTSANQPEPDTPASASLDTKE